MDDDRSPRPVVAAMAMLALLLAVAAGAWAVRRHALGQIAEPRPARTERVAIEQRPEALRTGAGDVWRLVFADRSSAWLHLPPGGPPSVHAPTADATGLQAIDVAVTSVGQRLRVVVTWRSPAGGFETRTETTRFLLDPVDGTGRREQTRVEETRPPGYVPALDD